jgi:hypothetical protein
MSMKKGTVGKSLSDLPSHEQHIAAAIGRRGLASVKSGMYWVAQWLWAMAECQKRHPEKSLHERKKLVQQGFGDRELELEIILNDAALKRDGKQLRLLADAIELTGCQLPIDPVSSFVLSQKSKGAKLLNDQRAKDYLKRVYGIDVSTRTLRRNREKLNAPKAKRGAPVGTKQKSVHR